MASSEDSVITKEAEVIYISDSDTELDSGSSAHMPSESEHETVWYYKDPQGNTQGPFSLSMLRAWRQQGYFDKAFKVWRTGQSVRDGVLLYTVARRRSA